ncbi:MAG: AAA family ATPase [Bacteroidia bacterium]|nr:AAA family ATPase [Bacteroidia bacterium]MDW8348120.1 AAA family ATPase [Bacteroidia bacterium]
MDTSVTQNNDIEITPEFEKAIQLLTNPMYNCVFITGKAGTGKSTLLKYYIHNLAPKNKTVVLAPTGIAAVNVGGQTIHSFFKFPTRILLEDDKEIERLPDESLAAQLIRTVEVIVIDEISMVRADIIDAIDTYLRINTKSYVAFGGKKMIFFGDLFQLPPILSAKEEQQDSLIEYFKKRYPSPYFFEAYVLKKQHVEVFELQTVHRQKDRDFTEILNKIRVADVKLYNDPYLLKLNQRYQPKFNINFQDESINLLTKNDDVNHFNKMGLSQLNGKIYIYNGIIQGEFNSANLPAPMELELKVGAKVMFLRNKKLALHVIPKESTDEEDKDDEPYCIVTGAGWQNGTLGRVEHLDEHNIIVSIIDEEDAAKRFVVVEKEVWENIRYEYKEVEENGKIEKKIVATVLGTYTQYPLKLAYAITIHKSQGMTFQKANVDVSAAFVEGQVYVALSRVRSLSGLNLITPVQPQRIRVNPRVVDFYQKYVKGS